MRPLFFYTDNYQWIIYAVSPDRLKDDSVLTANKRVVRHIPHRCQWFNIDLVISSRICGWISIIQTAGVYCTASIIY